MRQRILAFLILILPALGNVPAAAEQGWWNEMASPEQVIRTTAGADQLDTLARQAAALDLLADVVDTVADHAPGGNWRNRDQQNIYIGYHNASRATGDTARQLVSPNAGSGINSLQQKWNDLQHRYRGDLEFVHATLGKYVPPETRERFLAQRKEWLDKEYIAKNKQWVAEYERGRRQIREKDQALAQATTQQRAQAQEQAATLAALKRQVDADKRPGVDRTVFGIELGETLNLPPCTEGVSASDVFSGTAGLGRGARQTCIGDEAATLASAMMKAGQAATGLESPQTTVSVIPARLADKMCPTWVRMGGTCNIWLSVKEGLVLGAVLAPGASQWAYTEVMQQLTSKYGKPSKQGAINQCVNNLTGIVTDEWRDVNWTLPGLNVTYRPLVTDCKRGTIAVELDYLRNLRSQEKAAHEAQQPRM